jgi:hypothetical protein
MDDFINIDSCQYDTNQLISFNDISYDSTSFNISFDNISFDNISFNNISLNDKTKVNLIDNLYNKKYSHTTMEYYKAMRIRKMDPITMQDIKSDNVFAFKYMWDPYTGDRLGEDPYGPLYFDPHNLIKYFYTNRLNGLWVEPIDELGGYYEGYYDDGLGCGEDMFINSRGYHPERYLFRLPIIDCYLTDDHNNSIITMGPKLTNEEIHLIEELSNQNKNNYKNLFDKDKPNLINIKKLYDQAISQTPSITLTDNLSNEEIKELWNKANKVAVHTLVHMRG